MKTIKRSLCAGLLIFSSVTQAGDVPFIGEIQFFGGNFAPRGWALCEGQLLAISQNQALFSILGTTYGGDGRTTFALPDMRGRIPIHVGQGPGLSLRRLGDKAGSETEVLNTNQMPVHKHTLHASSNSARSANPANKDLARTRSNLRSYDNVSSTNPVDAQLDSRSIGNTGGAPINNMHPSVTVNCIIALQGVYPSRN